MASQISAKFQSVSEDFSSMGYDDTKQRHSAIDYKSLPFAAGGGWLGRCVTIPEARSGDSEWMAVPGFECPLNWLDMRTRDPGFSGLADGVHALTPLVMFYNLARKMPGLRGLAQIRESVDVTGQLDDNFQ
jgi:hypothetical protein